MRFGYSEELLQRCPELSAGVIWAKNVDLASAGAIIDERVNTAVTGVQERFPSTAEISSDPPLAAWRHIYSRLGVKPNRYPCAAENVTRQVVKSGQLPRLLPLVDLCNAASLIYAIPVAPIDRANIEQECVVRIATGSERFQPIGGKDIELIPAGEVVYADASPNVLSRRWNWRQADKSKVTAQTTSVLITTEAVHPDARETVRGILDMLTSVLGDCSTAVQTDILDQDNQWSEAPD